MIGAALVVAGCGWFKGPVNASPALRWWLFSNYGASQICPEMLKRSTPLRLAAGGNVVGRFFPEQCSVAVNDSSQTVTIDFSGSGHGWTPVAGRVGFWAGAAIEYKMDFYLDDDATYVWARVSRILKGPEFKMTAIEYKLANFAAQGPAGYLLNTFGAELMTSQLTQGFTVVNGEDGNLFTLGHLTPPNRSPGPFVRGADRYLFASEVTEVRSEQVDFLGPLSIESAGQALFLRLQVTGPAIDVLVVSRSNGDVWRRGLQQGSPLGPPPEPALTAWSVQPGGEQRQTLRLPAGQYYVVLDNSARVGSVNPPWNPLGVVGGNTAVVSYHADRGEVD